MKKLILDTYGADAGTEPIIAGALNALLKHEDLHLVLVGNTDDIHKQLHTHPELTERITILPTTDWLTNHEPPTSVLTDRPNCSTALSLNALKTDDSLLGMLSAGNTGAILVGSIFKLGLQPGLKTPALSALIPQAFGGYACLLDCGANIDCTAKDLVNFAFLGTDFMRRMYGTEAPRVALLNVGKEKGKGNPLTIEAYSLLSEAENLNFIGNIEGCDISLNHADVIVADGFAGNIVLKEVEATGKIAMNLLSSQAEKDGTKDHPTISSALGLMHTMFEMNSRGGATFLGTKKPIIKMHGVANSETVVSCVDQLLQYYQ